MEKMKQRVECQTHLDWLNDFDICQFKNKSILDLGCGSGYLCHHVMEKNATRAIGVDIVAPHPLYQSSFTYKPLDLDDSGFGNSLGYKSFDLIFAFDILEHVESPYAFLQECKALLADGGRLFLTTPNIMSWERFRYPKKWSGAQDIEHKILFSKYSLEFLLERAGFSKIQTKAPLRSLKKLSYIAPQVGGQLVSLGSL